MRFTDIVAYHAILEAYDSCTGKDFIAMHTYKQIDTVCNGQFLEIFKHERNKTIVDVSKFNEIKIDTD